jgi:putative PIN family toxin of toxin-antitoxin system
MRVFLDTNVIVSAMATRGLCGDIFRETLVRHQLIISETLLDEIRLVLTNKIGVPAGIIADLVALLQDVAVWATPAASNGQPLPSSADQALVSAAVQAKAEVFVTGDRELLDQAKTRAVDIITPRMFWERVIS